MVRWKHNTIHLLASLLQFQSYFWWMVRWKRVRVPTDNMYILFQSYFWWMVRWKPSGNSGQTSSYKVSILLLVDGALEVRGAAVYAAIALKFQSYFWWMVRWKLKATRCTMGGMGGFNPTFGGWCAGRQSVEGIQFCGSGVSILLLVDGALEEKQGRMKREIADSFNPTFGGWCAGSSFQAALQQATRRFNPTFGGWCAGSRRRCYGCDPS